MQLNWIKESKKNIKELQDALIQQYIKESVDPIVETIETNLYMGRYDFTESSQPKGKRLFVSLFIRIHEFKEMDWSISKRFS